MRTTLSISIVNWWVGIYIGKRTITFNESRCLDDVFKMSFLMSL